MKKLAYNKTTGELTKQIANTFMDSGISLTTAESCTGGLLAAALCAEADTAVSEQTVIEMSDGARVRAGTDISIAISGYAGPDGRSSGNNLVCVEFPRADSNKTNNFLRRLSGCH